MAKIGNVLIYGWNEVQCYIPDKMNLDFLLHSLESKLGDKRK